MEDFLDLLYDIEISGVPLLHWLILTTIILAIVAIVYFIKYKKRKHSDEELFKKAKDYLKKVEEYERKPLPLMMILVLSTLVVVEAAGFAYIFSEYILPDGTGSDLRMAAILGAIVIALILVPLTHITGEHIYYNSKVNKALSYIENDKDKYTFDDVDNTIEIENTFDDDNKSKSVRLVSRINFEWKNQSIKKKYLAQIFTWILIATIATTAYIVRDQTYEQIAIDEKISMKQETKDSMYNEQKEEEISDYLRDVVMESEEIHHVGKILAKERSNDTTYFLLSFLFLAIQVLGVYSGLRWGFVGRFSKEANEIKRGYKK